MLRVVGSVGELFMLKIMTNDPSTINQNSFEIRQYVYEIVGNVGLQSRLDYKKQRALLGLKKDLPRRGIEPRPPW